MNPRSDAWSAFIAKRYGRKMGLVRHLSNLARYHLGSFSSLEKVNWGRVTRLVFVCYGNICRSPYAEARAQVMGLPASSFGLNAGGEACADPNAVRAARARGLDLTAHRTRPSEQFSLASGDLLAVMESRQARVLSSWTLPSRVQLTLLGLWCIPPRPHIEDPFGLTEDYFETCFEVIDNALSRVSLLMSKIDMSPRSQ